MTMSFPNIAEFMNYLETRLPVVAAARHAGAEAAGAMLEAEAKNMVGQQMEQWPELAASTVAQKTARGQTGRVSATDPNLATGEFRASIRHEAHEGRVILGTDDPIAPYLEHGTSRMPPRPVISLTMFQKGEDAARLHAAHLMGAVAGRSGPMRSRGS